MISALKEIVLELKSEIMNSDIWYTCHHPPRQNHWKQNDRIITLKWDEQKINESESRLTRRFKAQCFIHVPSVSLAFFHSPVVFGQFDWCDNNGHKEQQGPTSAKPKPVLEN